MRPGRKGRFSPIHFSRTRPPHQPAVENPSTSLRIPRRESVVDSSEAETAADDMLREISDITRDGQVIYSDGVALDS